MDTRLIFNELGARSYKERKRGLAGFRNAKEEKEAQHFSSINTMSRLVGSIS